MIHHTFLFNQLPAHQLMPYLLKALTPLPQHDAHLPNQPEEDACRSNYCAWHLCWLNNDSQPVIGLLPRLSWTVYPKRHSIEPCLPQASNPVRDQIKDQFKDQTKDQIRDWISTPTASQAEVQDDTTTNTHATNQDTILLQIERCNRLSAVLNVNTETELEANQSLTQGNDKSVCTTSTTKYYSTYDAWINELIDYAQMQETKLTAPKSDLQQSFPDTIVKQDMATSAQATQSQTTQRKETTANNTEPSILYHNGLMGFIGYDIAAKALSPESEIALANQPSAFIAHYDIYLTPTASGEWQLHVQPDSTKAAIDLVMRYLKRVDHLLLAANAKHNAMSPRPILSLHGLWDIHQYQDAFAATQQYLYQGDSYQINLTQKWQGKLPSSFLPASNATTSISSSATCETPSLSQPPLLSRPVRLVDYLSDLHRHTQAPYAGYLCINHVSHSQQTDSALSHNHALHSAHLGINRISFELLSCSPELFVRFYNENGQQKILTKPIKGTVPRGLTKAQDKLLKQRLATSGKDRAENLMIVDLLRNDLGKYAQTASVHVPKLFAVESFSNVHHLVSTITAIIKPAHHPLRVLFDSLPAGSITGTPKKRAVEIISELEAAPRGAYCGTLGFLNFDRTGQWNVLIRSLQANKQGHVELWAGGGITVGSECAAEYQECQDKVGNLLHILGSIQKGSIQNPKG